MAKQYDGEMTVMKNVFSMLDW